MPPSRLSIACVVLLAAACASSRASARRPRIDTDTGRYGDRVLVEPMLIPAAWLQRDVDGGAPQPEQVSATGAGLRAALGNTEQSLGVLFQDFQGENGGLDVQTFCVDFDARTPIDETGGVIFVRAGGGFGAGWFDTRFGTSGQDLASQLRIGIDVQPIESFAIGISLGGLLLGHPGETEAYGTFVTLSAVLTF